MDVKPVAESHVRASTAIQTAPIPTMKLGQVGALPTLTRPRRRIHPKEQLLLRAVSAIADATAKPGDVGISSALISAATQTAPI